MPAAFQNVLRAVLDCSGDIAVLPSEILLMLGATEFQEPRLTAILELLLQIIDSEEKNDARLMDVAALSLVKVAVYKINSAKGVAFRNPKHVSPAPLRAALRAHIEHHFCTW